MPNAQIRPVTGSGGQEVVRLGELRHEEAPPPDLLTEYRGGTPDGSEGCCKAEVQDDSCPRWERPQTQGFHQAFDERGIIEATETGQPDTAVDQGGIAQRMR